MLSINIVSRGFLIICGIVLFATEGFCGDPNLIRQSTKWTSIADRCKSALDLAHLALSSSFNHAIAANGLEREFILKILRTSAGLSFFSDRISHHRDSMRLKDHFFRLFETHKVSQNRFGEDRLTKSPDDALNELLSAFAETGEDKKFLEVVNRIRLRFIQTTAADLESEDQIIERLAQEEFKYRNPNPFTYALRFLGAPGSSRELQSNLPLPEVDLSRLSALQNSADERPTQIEFADGQISFKTSNGTTERFKIHPYSKANTNYRFSNGSLLISHADYNLEATSPGSRLRDSAFRPSKNFSYISSDGRLAEIKWDCSRDCADLMESSWIQGVRSEKAVFGVFLDKSLPESLEFRIRLLGVNDRGESFDLSLLVPPEIQRSQSLRNLPPNIEELLRTHFYDNLRLEQVQEDEWNLRRDSVVIGKIRLNSVTSQIRFESK